MRVITMSSLPIAAASCLSYAINHDLWWAILHGICGWFYIFYYIFSIKGYV